MSADEFCARDLLVERLATLVERGVLQRRPAQGFIALFGDPDASYQEALDRHYSQGAPVGWEDEYVSSCNPITRRSPAR